MLAVGLLFTAFTIRIRGNHHHNIPPYYVTDALSSLRKYDPVHIEIVPMRYFDDEITVDATMYGRNGTRYEATTRGSDLLPALRDISQRTFKKFMKSARTYAHFVRLHDAVEDEDSN